MEMLIDYLIRLLPGIGVLVLIYLLMPKPDRLMKIFLLIFAFILVRDTMTPLGFWQLEITDNVLWIRFIENAMILGVMGLVSLIFSLSIYYLDPYLHENVPWLSPNHKIGGLIVG